MFCSGCRIDFLLLLLVSLLYHINVLLPQEVELVLVLNLKSESESGFSLALASQPFGFGTVLNPPRIVIQPQLVNYQEQGSNKQG